MYHAITLLNSTDSLHRCQQLRKLLTIQECMLVMMAGQKMHPTRWVLVRVHIRRHLPPRWYLPVLV